jgi:hypothetical protein
MWQNSKLVIHCEISKTERKNVKKLINNAKFQYYNKQVDDCSRDQAKLFKITNSLLNTAKSAVLPTHESPQKLADEFNTFFVSKIAKIRLELEEKSTSPDISVVDVPCFSGTQLAEFQPATTVEINKIIKKSSKATCSLDPIPTRLLCDKYLDVLCPVITKIVNKSLMSGIFPTIFKQALVCPLLKKPSLDADSLKNYRPVSNLPFVSKIIEKVVSARISDHMKKHDLHETLQSAFKAGHSTETALVRVQNDVLHAVDRKEGVFLVLLDLSEAFDTIDHTMLTDFLKDYIGINDKWSCCELVHLILV